MRTFTQSLHQIVYSTKNRDRTLRDDDRDKLFRYKTGILKNKNCHLYQIGGVSDHLHIVTSIHPSICIAGLVKDLKLASTDYIKAHHLFSGFTGWQDGYAAFTYAIGAKKNLIDYVINQAVHHQKKTYIEELKELLIEHEIEFDERFLL